MGGHINGGEAATAVCAALEETLPKLLPQVDLRSARDRKVFANKLFIQTLLPAAMDTRGHTTCTLAIVKKHRCRFFWVGDSPGYVLRRGIDFIYKIRGAISQHGVGNTVYKGLGYGFLEDSGSTPEYKCFEFKKNDLLVVCSDGADPFFDDKSRLRTNLKDLATLVPSRVIPAARFIVDRSYEQGSTDNTTVIVVKSVA
jgi:serine/threonine protein phosphatase PrpC